MPRRFVYLLPLAMAACNGAGTANDALPAEEALDPAVGKLLADAGYGSAEVETVSRVVWRNASLGCPEKGMAYAQVLVNGYLIIADIDGTPTRLHTSDQGRVIACPADRSQPPLEQVKN